jgi:hypothetical protein
MNELVRLTNKLPIVIALVLSGSEGTQVKQSQNRKSKTASSLRSSQ